MLPETRKRLEKLLALTGALSSEEISALRDRDGEDLADAAAAKEGGSAGRALQILAEVYRLPAVSLAKEKMDSSLLSGIAPELCRRAEAVPLRIEEGQAIVAFADPENLAAVDEIRLALGRPVRPAAALRSDIRRFLHGDAAGDVRGLVAEIVQGVETEDGPPLRVTTDSEAGKPAVVVVDRLIAEAVRRQALHVSLIPFPDDKVRVRFFLAGRIVEIKPLETKLYHNVVGRLRVLADLIGKDRRAPQSGSFLTLVEGQKHRVDVLIVPAAIGPAVTLCLDQELASDEESPSPSAAAACPACGESLQPRWRFCPLCGRKRA